MKLALILPRNPGNGTPLGRKVNAFLSSDGVLLPPIGLAYLAAYVRNHGHQVIIVDSNVMKYGAAEIIDILKPFKPDMTGYMTHAYYFHEMAALAAEVRKQVPSAVVFGGYYLSEISPEVLRNDTLDFAVKGEGEQTLLELMEVYSSGSGEYKDVRGLIYKDREGVHINEDRPVVANLDDFPFPARDLLPNHSYRTFLSRDKAITCIISSRGCPFHCYFCMATFMKYRRRSADAVVEEMRECKKRFGTEEFCFYDSTFITSKKWVREFCEKLASSDLNVQWNCSTRIDSIEEETIAGMAAVGCNRLNLGVESGSLNITTSLNKPISPEQLKHALRIVRKHGITSYGYFMMGNPGDTRKSMRETVNAAIKNRFDYVQFTSLNPWPGTKLYEDYCKKTNSDPFEDYLRGISDNRNISVCESFSVEDLNRIVSSAYRRFYIRLSFIISQLKLVKDFKILGAYFRGLLSIMPSFRK